MDPNSFDMIMQEIEHLHYDIHQIGWFVLCAIGLLIMLISKQGIDK